MSTTRSGDMVSQQIGKIGVISGLNNANFKSNSPFNLKNDGETDVFLDINLWSMEPGEYIKTRIFVGWNPEIIREIKKTSQTGLKLCWGY